FGKRFFAAFIDMIILVAIIFLFFNLVGFFDAYSNMFEEIKDISGDRQAIKELQEEFFRSNAFNLAFPAVLYLIYFLSEAIAGVSFGKYILGLRIGNLRGEKASKKSLWVRYLVKNSGGIMSLLWLVTQLSFFNLLNSILGSTLILGFFLILSRNRQNLQDIIAKTAVYLHEDLEETGDNENLLIKIR
ncbi:MAG: RDD family protein, partial [Candidatus Kapaibacteriota bacterium]